MTHVYSSTPLGYAPRFGSGFVKGKNPGEVKQALDTYPYKDHLTVTESTANPDDTAVLGHKKFNDTLGTHLGGVFGQDNVHIPWCKDWSPEKIAEYIKNNPPG